MQKLVTIYLDSAVYGAGKWLGMAVQDKHGIVEEHLEDELRRGWNIVSINCFGGAAESMFARGWVVVVIEKLDEADGERSRR
jgi:hypothetical protein